jgi:NADH:ubiquinone oxidoreductase subunit E
VDDILIYSNNLREHKEHITAVMTSLKEAGLYLKAEKCDFHKEEVKYLKAEKCDVHKEEVKYLKLIVGVYGIIMDLEKVQAVENWEPQEKLNECQAILGLANFYRRFIRNYSTAFQPLT